MAIPLIIPIAIIGAGALGGTGAYFGTRQAGEENTFITNQKSVQQDFISNITTFDFNNAVVENSSIDFRNTVTQETGDKMAEQLSTQERKSVNPSNLSTYLLIGGAGVGAFMLWRYRK